MSRLEFADGVRSRLVILNARKVFSDFSLCFYQLETGQIEAHPAWEDAIEWRNAVEQLDRIQLGESIFQWLQDLLRQSVNCQMANNITTGFARPSVVLSPRTRRPCGE